MEQLFAPKNAYQNIVKTLTPLFPVLANINGGLIQRHFSWWLDDLPAAQAQMLVQFESIRDQFLGLAFLASGTKLPSLLQSVAAAQAIMTSNCAVESHLYLAEMWPQLFTELERPDMPFIGEFRQTGVSQYHRQRQQMLRGQAIQFLLEIRFYLDAVEHQRKLRIKLKPFFAMPGGNAHSIRQLAMTMPLYSIENMYSKGQRAVYDSFVINNIEYIFDQTFDPEFNQKSYWRWHYRTAYAAIEHEHATVLSAPIGLPPFFCAAPGQFVSMFCHPPAPGLFVTESGYSFAQVDSQNDDSILDAVQFAGELKLGFVYLMQAICAAATIVSLTTQTGSGIHKPVWTGAPMTTAILNMLPRVWQYSLKFAKEQVS